MANDPSAPAPTPTPAPARRIFPLSIQGGIDLDAIKTIADLEAKVAEVAAAARDAIFRELVKRDPPTLAVVPPAEATGAE